MMLILEIVLVQKKGNKILSIWKFLKYYEMFVFLVEYKKSKINIKWYLFFNWYLIFFMELKNKHFFLKCLCLVLEK